MKYILSLLLFLSVLPAFAVEREALGVAMSDLDRALARRVFFIERRQAGIDSLQELRKAAPDSMELLLQIGKKYTGFDNDSAIVYLSYGVKHAPEPINMEFRWNLAAIQIGRAHV